MELIILIALGVVGWLARRRFDALETRVRLLEARLDAAGRAGAPTVVQATDSTPAPPVPESATVETGAAPPEPAAETVSPAAPPEPPPVQPAAPPRGGLEERFGTQWVVWAGGLTLALGGIFLVRYSIEQDLLGPGVRVALGALLALALLAAGEWTRRTERLAGIAALPTAHIPGILTAAGTVTAYAVIYAAYALYDMVPPAAAFVLLGIVALGTLAAALLHGPALAGLGLVGAYVTPLLVTSEAPSYWALYLYLAAVSGAAFALARLRLWRWLALTAIVFALLWTLPGLDEWGGVTELGAHVFHVVAGFALAAALLVAGLFYGPAPTPGRIDWLSATALAAFVFAALLVTLASDQATPALAAFVLLVAATLAIAWRTDAAVAALPAIGAMVVLLFVNWPAVWEMETLLAPSGVTVDAIPNPPAVRTTLHLVLGFGFAAAFGIAGFLAQPRSAGAIMAMLWSGSAAFVPVALLAALYLRIAGFEPSFAFALAGLGLAAAYATAVEALSKQPVRPGLAAAQAIFATASIAALALAFTMALERGWLTVALALMVPGVAWIESRRPLPALRWLAAALTTLVVLRVGWEPRIVGDLVGTTSIFNWLLYGYGIPAAGFWFASHLLRRRADDAPTRTVEAGAILFTVLLVVWQIRHLVNGGDIYRPTAALAEIGAQVCAGLAMTIGLERLRLRSGSIVHDLGALVIAGLTLFAIVFGLSLFMNPAFTGRPVGGLFVNLLLLGYGVPAVLAAILALMTRKQRPFGYSSIAGIVAVALALAYLTLQVTRIYHGEVLTRGGVSDAEQYTYSAVWLAFGVALLGVGVVLKSQPMRLASAAVVALTVGKAFLVDMSDLTGIYRALSFIGLGLVLMGIGVLYQRLLFPRRR